jgi:hypothetical protein
MNLGSLSGKPPIIWGFLRQPFQRYCKGGISNGNKAGIGIIQSIQPRPLPPLAQRIVVFGQLNKWKWVIWNVDVSGVLDWMVR